MVLVKFTHTAGAEIYVNPSLVRMVQPQGAKGARLVFDPNHEVFVKEETDQVLRLLERVGEVPLPLDRAGGETVG